jgi:hypothetical protein
MKGDRGRFLIVSVLGRGGDGGYQTLTFNIKLLSRRLSEKLRDEDVRGQGKLVSAELSKHLANKGYSVTLAYLVTYSLIKSCGCEDDSLIEMKALNTIDHTLGSTLQELKDIGVEVKPIPAEWLGVCDNVNWEMNPDSIRLRLILELEEFLGEPGSSRDLMIIADTSIGLNAYIALLLDVVRVVTVAEMMRRLPEGNVELYMLTQEPVLPRTSVSNVNAFILDLPVVAFAKMPLGLSNIRNLKVTRIVDAGTCPELMKRVIEFNKTSEFESTLRKTLFECLRLFNAVNNNTPLYIAHMLTGSGSPSFEKELHFLWSKLYALLREVLRHRKCGENKVSTCVSAHGYDTLRDVMISLSLCEGLVKLAHKHIDKLDKSSQGYINLESLKIFAEHMYRDIEERMKADFALNRLLLSRDVRSIRRDLGIEDDSELGDLRRNFFAHSGLAKDVIECQAVDDKIYVKYREDKLNEVRSWLELDVKSLA